MAKIVIVGAGGVIFTQNFIRDILLDDELRKSRVVLMDINAERLGHAGKMAEIISGQFGRPFRPELTTDLRKAVRGADYVLTVFRVGTLEHQRLEYEIPAGYGVRQVVADTLGPGGVFRGLRTLKALFEVLDMMEQECPGAYLLNYVNPMSMNTIALSRRAKTVKVIGLCHSVQGTASRMAAWLKVPPEKLHFYAAGVNHQAFLLKLESEGRDLYPELRKCMDNPEFYNRDKVRFEIMRHFGYFPTESSGHGSEYNPYFRKRADLLEKFCSVTAPPDPDDRCCVHLMSAGVSGASLTVCARLQERNEEKLRDLLSGKEKVEALPSMEYGVRIIGAMEKNQPFSANLNVMNNGLIPTLPPGACVEVPCLVDGSGVQGTHVGALPVQCAALNMTNINVQLLTIEAALTQKKEHIYQAAMLDPHTSAELPIDTIVKLCDDLIKAHGDMLPKYR